MKNAVNERRKRETLPAHKSLPNWLLVFWATVCLLPATVFSQPVFTGNVEADFGKLPRVVTISDPGGRDVLATASNAFRDIKDVRFFYDAAGDEMYVGINVFQRSGAPRNGLFAVQFDLDEDGISDVIAGVSSLGNGEFSVNRFRTGAVSSDLFGAALPEHLGVVSAGSGDQPDIEFSIKNFSSLPLSSGSDENPGTFLFNARTGSDGNGAEADYMPASGQFALAGLVAIGGFVWHDLNADGLIDRSEPGVPGITVNVLDTLDQVIATMTTNADGEYDFEIEEGTYVLEFIPPDPGLGYTGFTKEVDVPRKNSDVNPITGRTGRNTFTPGPSVVIDVGLISPDFGDAPESYFTSLTNNGARHLLDGMNYLGAQVDGELNGQPGSEADLDDKTDFADEDGVVFPNLLLRDGVANIEVTTSMDTAAADSGYLNAWVDFNGSGAFDSPQEQVFTDQVLKPGSSTLQINVPKDAVGAFAFARFRYSTMPGLTPTGEAPDGEVEDYRIEILEALECTITDIAPPSGAKTANETQRITAMVNVTGGKPGYTVTGTGTVNGTPITVTHNSDGTISADAPLNMGDNEIVISCTVTDAVGNTTMCETTMTLERVGVPVCEITDVVSSNGVETLEDSTVISAVFSVSGGAMAFKDTTCKIIVNGEEFPVTPSDSGAFSRKIPLNVIGDAGNEIEISCTVTDALSQTVSCDTAFTVFRYDTLTCEITDIAPHDGASVKDSMVTLTAMLNAVGGKATFERGCEITVNGGAPIAATCDSTGLLQAEIALKNGANEISISATIMDSMPDSLKQTAFCDSTITIHLVDSVNCQITEIDPPNGHVTADSMIEITAKLNIFDGAAPYSAACTLKVNGAKFPAVHNSANSTFSATVLLEFDENMITLSCTVTDSLNCVTNCDSTITITRAPTPECFITEVTPADGFETLDEMITVSGKLTIEDGIPPYDTTECKISVNGLDFPVSPDTSGFFSAEDLPLTIGANEIIISCSAMDSIDQPAECADTLTVTRFGPPECKIVDIVPPDGAETADDTISVKWNTQIIGGRAPYNTSCAVILNGVQDVPFTRGADGFLSGEISLNEGENTVFISCIITDSFGQQTTCDTTITITKVGPPECEIVDISPPDGTVTTQREIEISARLALSGGASAGNAVCNFILPDTTVAATHRADSTFFGTVPLKLGDNPVTISCVYTDSLGQTTNCDSTIIITRNTDLMCETIITAPADDDSISAPDNVEVVFKHLIDGGVPPFSTVCQVSVNGGSVVTATQLDDTTYSALVPIVIGENEIIVSCDMTDQDGGAATCSDTITVKGKPIECRTEFVTLVDSILATQSDTLFVCADTAEFSIRHTVEHAVGTVTTICDVNGVTATENDSVFSATLPLALGYNTIVATCTATDTLGRVAVCADTMTVFSDITPPFCELDFSMHSDDSATVKGKIWDYESGIDSIQILKLINRNIRFSDFVPGDTVVTFVSKRTGRQGGTSLDMLITNVAGCSTFCDPVEFTLEPDSLGCLVEATIPDYDRFIQIENYGVRKISVKINGGKTLNFIAGDGENAACETYFMERNGLTTFEWGDCLDKGENNLEVTCEGPEGSYAKVLIIDSPITRTITAISDEQAEPENKLIPIAFTLHQNYPNPFNPETTISFDVPPGWAAPVKLQIFNSAGQLVRKLIDNTYAPGSHSVIWDARNDHGQVVATGVYVYRIVSGNISITRRAVLTK